MTAPPWPTRVLGDPSTATISSGGTPSRARPDYFGGPIKWVKSGDLNDSELNNTEETITQSAIKHSAAKILPANTVLIAMYGATVGKTALLTTEAATNQAVCAIRVNQAAFDPHFLQFVLMQRRPQLLRERYGGAQPNISQTIIRNLELPCPSLEQQVRIASVLRLVRGAAELEDKVIATIRELQKAAVRHLFASGSRHEPQKDTELGPLPRSWDVAPLEHLRLFLQYGTSARCDYTQHGNPVLRIPNVIDGQVNWDDLKWCELATKDVDSLVLASGDILFVRTNGVRERVGSCAVYRGQPERALFASYLIRARLDTERLHPDFLRYYTGTEAGVSFLGGRALPAADGKFNINMTTLDSLLVPVPPLDEQLEIVQTLQAIDQSLTTYSRKRSAFRELFKKLLHDLMTGQVSVDQLETSPNEVTAA